MLIKHLSLNGFRCIESFELSSLNRIVAFSGSNASGKSSILEAILLIIGNSANGFITSEWSSIVTDKSLSVHLHVSLEEIKELVEESYYDRFSNHENYVLVYSHVAPFVKLQPENPGISDKILNNLVARIRSRIINYTANRSFEISATSVQSTNYNRNYRELRSGEFQNRVNYLSYQLSILLLKRQNEWAKKTKRKQLNMEDRLNPSDYEGLKEVEEIFNDFFVITGKKWKEPDFDDKTGNYRFFFEVPWSDNPIPLSELSSGEQWILLFFVEMAINEWNNNIFLIDEIEQHLHPKLALDFIERVDNRDDLNQYWFTTHSPIIANYLHNKENTSLFGLVLNDEYKTEVMNYSEDILYKVLSQLSGSDGIIPIAKRIVILEGSQHESPRFGTRQFSADQLFFRTLKEKGLIFSNIKNIEFVSVTRADYVELSQRMLTAIQNQIGTGWQVYAIIDRDALPDESRHNYLNKENNHVWIWKRSSIEGYLIEPRLIQNFLTNHVTPVPSVQEIKNQIFDYIRNHRDDIIKRYERQLIYLTYKRGEEASIDNLKNTSSSTILLLEKQLDSFIGELDEWIRNVETEWRKILPFINCKSFLRDTINNWYTGPRISNNISKFIRSFLTENINFIQSENLLSSEWKEIADICSVIEKEESFNGLI